MGLLNLALVAGESANASSWLLVGILIGSAFRKNLCGVVVSFGLASGLTKPGEQGTSVSELAAEAIPEIPNDPLAEVSVSEETPLEIVHGTWRLLNLRHSSSKSSVDDSPGGWWLKVTEVFGVELERLKSVGVHTVMAAVVM